LVVGIIGVALAVLITNYFDGSGNWPLIEPDRITLIDIEGRPVTILANPQMDQIKINAFEKWLKSNGLSRLQTKEDSSATATFRGKYKGSLPITVTIESKETTEAAEIHLSFKGAAPKWSFEKRVKLVKIFSNNAVKKCIEKDLLR